MRTTTLPANYEEQVYAGVLGKVIGVYLGRPFEGWTNERIERELGEIDYYVHDRLNVPLIVTDDDISGTFTFIRALEDQHYNPDITAAQIGQSWLNYLIKERTVLWWGGMGNSTEHTAYLRLCQGYEAPESGSMALNGKVVSEQIGAQIFIDGWALVSPGDPERAAELARRAGSVSHDGEAIYGAQVIAALEAQAFVESDINKLIDTAVQYIPGNSVLYKMINDVREWHAATPTDWRASFRHIQDNYGYDKFGGNCHMIPNHGLIIHSLLHSDGDFSEALKIVNTAGWDTDCNAGNVGCIMGLVAGLEGINAGPDWRGPVADRLFLPTAEPGRAISDAATEAVHIINAGRALDGQAPVAYKDNARFHFTFPGSVQGFISDAATLDNVLLADATSRALRIAPTDNAGVRVTTATFVASKAEAKYFEGRGYALMASPTLSPGQQLRACVSASSDNNSNVSVALVINHFDAEDEVTPRSFASHELAPGQSVELQQLVPDLAGFPIASVGIEINNGRGSQVDLEWLTWDGEPNVALTRTKGGLWHRAWVNGVDAYQPFYPEPFRLIQNEGTGLLIHGSREWQNYSVSADVTPHMARRAGVAVRVQGMRRWYALLLCADNTVQLVKSLHDETVLASAALPVVLGQTYDLVLTANGSELVGVVDGIEVLRATDTELGGGAAGLLCTEGRTATHTVTLAPAV